MKDYSDRRLAVSAPLAGSALTWIMIAAGRTLRRTDRR